MYNQKTNTKYTTMKWLLSTLVATILSSTTASSSSIPDDNLFNLPSSIVKSDSFFGKRILSQARLLNSDGSTFSESWVAGYSLVFSGCHHISQWNNDANNETDVRITTKRLVRFRLCPSDSCSQEGYGCTTNYGDYIIDMNTYLQSWFEAKKDYQAFRCEYLQKSACNCDESENIDKCLWDCYTQHNMQSICMTSSPYSDDQSVGTNSASNLNTYMSCAEASFTNNNRRALQSSDEWDGKYYIGPYCASQGGSIFIGMFTDDSCSNFADSTGGRQTFFDLTNTELPYGDSNVVDVDCLPCKEPDMNNVDGDDTSDTDTVTEVCEKLYTDAGKCEQYYTDGIVSYPNTNACNYMKGIKIVRKDGTVHTAATRAKKTASIFIGMFVVMFILLCAYSFYLKTRLDRASINLA